MHVVISVWPATIQQWGFPIRSRVHTGELCVGGVVACMSTHIHRSKSNQGSEAQNELTEATFLQTRSWSHQTTTSLIYCRTACPSSSRTVQPSRRKERGSAINNARGRAVSPAIDVAEVGGNPPTSGRQSERKCVPICVHAWTRDKEEPQALVSGEGK
jgi:hypothetical protein